jgi:hypothetical protein
MGYSEGKLQRNEALLRALGQLEPIEEPPEESEGKVNFDGGVRESVPLASDPMQEHDELLYELLRAQQVEEGPPW